MEITGIKIEKAERPDLSRILEVQRLAFTREAEEFRDFAIEPMTQTLADLEREFETFLFLKAVDERGEIIGSTRGHVEVGTSYIGKTFVHPDFQGHGIGSQLIRALEDLNRAQRYEINSSIRCPQNIRLYESLGYRRFRETRTANNGFVYLEKYEISSKGENTMNHRKFGNTGFEISAVTYGGIVSASEYDGHTYDPDGQASSDRQVAWAIEQGVNYFDVAPTYGNAQRMLGNSLIPYRKDVYLACKTEKRLRAAAEPEMEESLRLLHTDHFDVYQMHALSTMEDLEQAFGPGGVMELMRDMKEKGITRKLGITAHSEAVALKALALYDFDTVLFPFNWHMSMVHGMGDTLVKTAKEKGVGVLCMKSMIDRAWDSQEERYVSKYPKSWCRPFDTEEEADLLTAAVKYALSLGVDTIVPPGNFDHFQFAVEHIDEMLAQPFSDADRTLLEARLEQVKDRPFFGPECYTL